MRAGCKLKSAVYDAATKHCLPVFNRHGEGEAGEWVLAERTSRLASARTIHERVLQQQAGNANHTLAHAYVAVIGTNKVVQVKHSEALVYRPKPCLFQHSIDRCQQGF